MEEKKQQEILQKQGKIEELSRLKEKQEKERKEQLRKNQEAFRKFMQDRKDIENSQQFLSPIDSRKAKTSSKVSG